MKNFLRGFSTDLIYSIAALFVLNGVIQLVLYPQLSLRIGETAFGDVLTLLSVISIIATSFGSAANYSRMLASNSCQTENGDYNIFLIIICILSIPIGCIALYTLNQFNFKTAIIFSLLFFATIFRYYADVEFRLNLNYKHYFGFYSAIAIGYVGSLLLNINSWILIFLYGELAGLLFSAWKSSLFTEGAFKLSSQFKVAVFPILFLASSNLLSNLVLNADRLVIRYTIGSEAVTVFYVATLLGKVVAMFSTPLNGVLIGYLTKYESIIKKKHLILIFLACIIFVFFGSFACWIGSYILIPWLYPAIFDTAKPLFFLANTSQIFYFISNTLMVLVMKMKDEKISLWVSLFHAVMFVLFVIPASIMYGLIGTTISLMIVNALKFLLIIWIGYKAAK